MSEEINNPNLSVAPKLPEKKEEHVLIRAIRLFFEKFGSRKLLAFIVATVLFALGSLTEPHFMYVLMMYIGVQTGLDLFDKVKGKFGK